MAAGALLLRAALPLGPGYGIYPLALAAVVLNTWYFGRGPAWGALVFSVVGVRYFFIDPKHSFTMQPGAAK